MASSLDKDPYTYQKERETFLKELWQFHQSRGTAYTRTPSIGGKEVDLYLLYSKVNDLGGWDKVTDRDIWEDIVDFFRIPRACTNASHALKHIYLRYLFVYYKVHKGDDPDLRPFDTDDAETTRKRAKMPHRGIQMRYNTRQHNVSDSMRVAAGMSLDLVTPHEYAKLEKALLSGLPNEVDFALNVCTLLSNEGKRTLIIDKCPNLVRVLLAQIGLFTDGPGSLQNLYEDGWKVHNKRNYIRFWLDSVIDQEAKSLISSKALSSKETDLPMDLGDGEESKIVDEQTAPVCELLNINRELGVHDAEGQRVLQMAMIIRNLSFEEDNLSVLASDLVVFRFLQLCIYSKYNSLKQLALDTIGNLSKKITLDPMEFRTSKLFIRTITDSISSKDKFQVIRGLEIVANIGLTRENFSLLSDKLEACVYSDIINMLLVHDIQLIVYTLEALYQLSEMGEATTTHIANVKSAIGILIDLLTVEAQSYGPNSLIGIKVIEHVPPPSQLHHMTTVQQVPALQSLTGSPMRTPGAPPQMARAPAPTLATQGAHHVTPQRPAGQPSTPVRPVLHQQGLPPSPAQPIPQPMVPSRPQQPSPLPASPHPEMDAESLAKNWLQTHIEGGGLSIITRAELYAEYLASCGKQGIRNVINTNSFANCVRVCFPKVDSARVENEGAVEINYKGLQRKLVPLPFPCNLNAAGQPVHQSDAKSSLIQQQLASPVKSRKAAPPALPMAQASMQHQPPTSQHSPNYPTIHQALLQKAENEASPPPAQKQFPSIPTSSFSPNQQKASSAPDSNLIKSLLANKVTANMNRLHQQQVGVAGASPCVSQQLNQVPSQAALPNPPSASTQLDQPQSPKSKLKMALAAKTTVTGPTQEVLSVGIDNQSFASVKYELEDSKMEVDAPMQNEEKTKSDLIKSELVNSRGTLSEKLNGLGPNESIVKHESHNDSTCIKPESQINGNTNKILDTSRMLLSESEKLLTQEQIERKKQEEVLALLELNKEQVISMNGVVNHVGNGDCTVPGSFLAKGQLPSKDTKADLTKTNGPFLENGFALEQSGQEEAKGLPNNMGAMGRLVKGSLPHNLNGPNVKPVDERGVPMDTTETDTYTSQSAVSGSQKLLPGVGGCGPVINHQTYPMGIPAAGYVSSLPASTPVTTRPSALPTSIPSNPQLAKVSDSTASVHSPTLANLPLPGDLASQVNNLMQTSNQQTATAGSAAGMNNEVSGNAALTPQLQSAIMKQLCQPMPQQQKLIEQTQLQAQLLQQQQQSSGNHQFAAHMQQLQQRLQLPPQVKWPPMTSQAQGAATTAPHDSQGLTIQTVTTNATVANPVDVSQIPITQTQSQTPIQPSVKSQLMQRLKQPVTPSSTPQLQPHIPSQQIQQQAPVLVQQTNPLTPQQQQPILLQQQNGQQMLITSPSASSPVLQGQSQVLLQGQQPVQVVGAPTQAIQIVQNQGVQMVANQGQPLQVVSGQGQNVQMVASQSQNVQVVSQALQVVSSQSGQSLQVVSSQSGQTLQVVGSQGTQPVQVLSSQGCQPLQVKAGHGQTIQLVAGQGGQTQVQVVSASGQPIQVINTPQGQAIQVIQGQGQQVQVVTGGQQQQLLTSTGSMLQGGQQIQVRQGAANQVQMVPGQCVQMQLQAGQSPVMQLQNQQVVLQAPNTPQARPVSITPKLQPQQVVGGQILLPKPAQVIMTSQIPTPVSSSTVMQTQTHNVVTQPLVVQTQVQKPANISPTIASNLASPQPIPSGAQQTNISQHKGQLASNGQSSPVGNISPGATGHKRPAPTSPKDAQLAKKGRQGSTEKPPKSAATIEYMCEWAGCKICFDTAKLVSAHVVKEHYPAALKGGFCQWEGCDKLKRQKWSLVTHIQDRHLTAGALKTAHMKRQHVLSRPASTQATPAPTPATPPVYPPDAANQAIRRFAPRQPYPDFQNQVQGGGAPQQPQQHVGGGSPVRPPPPPQQQQAPQQHQHHNRLMRQHYPPIPPFEEPKEGPVTKHIRLTSALILRNIAKYSEKGRSLLSRHEQHLAYVSLSSVEASTAVAHCLWELHRHPTHNKPPQ